MPKKKKNQTAENNIVDYQQLMRLIDQGDLKEIETWVNKNKLKPAFNLNQSIKYKLLKLKPIEWYCQRFPQCYKFSEQGHIFHLLSSYPEVEEGKGISAVSSVNFEPFFIKGLLKNMGELEGKSSAFFQFSNDRGENLIHQVIRSPREWKLIQYIPELSRRGVNVNQLNNQDEPPIFVAVYLRYIEALHYLNLSRSQFFYHYERWVFDTGYDSFKGRSKNLSKIFFQILNYKNGLKIKSQVDTLPILPVFAQRRDGQQPLLSYSPN